MKRTMLSAIALLLCVAMLLSFASCGPGKNGSEEEGPSEIPPEVIDPLAQLITYPAYTGIATDSLYSVTVRQYNTAKALTVYNQAADYPLFSASNGNTGVTRSLGSLDSNRRFCEFAFEHGAVTVEIRVNKKFNGYVVSPSSREFASSYRNGVISVILQHPEYFVLILDDDYNTALAVFADAPETDVPAKGEKDVVYVDADGSITDPGNLVAYSGPFDEVITITRNDARVYIAPGAVLKKRLVFTQKWVGEERLGGYNAHNIKVYGRGMILDPYSDIAHSDLENRPETTNFDRAVKKVESTVSFYGYSCSIEDVKIVDSREYNVLFGQSYCTANHVKLLSSEMSTDGFTAIGELGTQSGGIVENCFVYVGDNALVIQNPKGKTGYTFRNILIGTTCAAIYPQYHAKATLEDIYVFRADDGLINVHEPNVGSQTVTINRLDALDCVKTPTLFKTNGGEGTEKKTFCLNNVVMRNTTGNTFSFVPGATPWENTAIRIAKDNSAGYVLNFTNLYIGGSYISGNRQTGAAIKVNDSLYDAGTAGAIVCSFARDEAHLPAHTDVPANQTANYTGAAEVVAGPVDALQWTRHKSFACVTKYSGGVYTAVKTSASSGNDWGFVLNLTEYAKQNGAGTYKITFQPSANVKYHVVKASVKSGAVDCTAGNNVSVRAGTLQTVSVSVTDVVNYNWFVVVRSDGAASFSLSNIGLVKASSN